MPQWDAGQYLKFSRQRTRPSEDLAAAICLERPQTILDAGCGPGNSTEVLARRWPSARLTGVDLSEDMLKAARERLPDVTFYRKDLSGSISDLGQFDVVFSNAALQWLADMESAVLRLFDLVKPGGVLAVQVPDCLPHASAEGRLETGDAHAAMRQTALEEAFAPRTASVSRLKSLPGERVYALLSDKAKTVDMWETRYCHQLDGYEGLLEWYRGTGMRPYLEALPDKEVRRAFEMRFLEKISAAHALEPDGKLLFWFRRLFFIAYR